MKPNCYDCKWRATLVGDAHSQCVHPKINSSDRISSPMLIMMGQQSQAQKRLNVYGDETGIRGGWFLWPINFDPTWLKSCDGFECKEKEEHENTSKTGKD